MNTDWQTEDRFTVIIVHTRGSCISSPLSLLCDVPVFPRKHIATCDFRGGLWVGGRGPDPPPPWLTLTLWVWIGLFLRVVERFFNVHLPVLNTFFRLICKCVRVSSPTRTKYFFRLIFKCVRVSLKHIKWKLNKRWKQIKGCWPTYQQGIKKVNCLGSDIKSILTLYFYNQSTHDWMDVN